MSAEVENKRRFPRFDVSHCEEIGGSIPEAGAKMKMVSLGQGGCGFVSIEADSELVPPRKVLLNVFSREGDKYRESHFVLGELVYLRLVNFSERALFQYGVRFSEKDLPKITPVIAQLEAMADQGSIQKT